MRARWIAAFAVAALTMPAGALAGGWATVELSSTPDDLDPGQAWVVDMTVLQHGRTPLADVKPTITINGPGTTRTFVAAPTENVGVYRAQVVFPRAGRWTYEVDDGFSQQFTYPAVEIGGQPATAVPPAPADRPASSASGEGFPWTALLAALGTGLLGAAAVAAVRRRRERPAGPPAVEG